MHRKPLVCLFLLTIVFWGCGHSKEGPTPEVGQDSPAVSPQAVCTEQLTTTVTVSGEGMSPLPIKVMEDQPQLALPGVALLLSQDLTGAPATADAVSIPDDPADPGASRVHWFSQQRMTFQVYPELQLGNGLYTVQVTNPNGNAGQWSDSLLAVPRPTALEISPDILCADKPSQFTLSGTTFIRNGEQMPVVTATPKQGDGEPVELTPASMEDCTDLPGSSGLQACTKLIVDLDSGTLPSTEVFLNYAITVTNPDPVGCHSTEEVLLTMVPAPELTQVDPELICTAQGDNTLTLTGTGFLTIDGQAPTLAFDSKVFETTASDCTEVTGPSEDVQSCTTLTVTVKQDELAPATYGLAVTNPSPADCVTSNPIKLAVVPPPKIDAVEPDIVCNDQGDLTLTVKGSGFITVTDSTGSAALPTVSLDGQTFSPSAGGCSEISGLVNQVQTCTELTFTVPQGTLSSGTHVVTVTNPAPADCVSEDQVTLTVVPPPEVSDVTPDIVCPTGSGQQVTITGSGFLTIDGAVPEVSINGTSLTPTASDCTELAGPTEAVEQCTTLSVTIPEGTSTGLQELQVTNPTPAGCVSAGINIYVAEPPVLTALTPPDLCSNQVSSSVTLSGTGFLVVDGNAAEAAIDGQALASTAAGCTPVTGLKESLEVCTELVFSITVADLAMGPHDVSVTNPPPAACSGSNTLTMSVLPPPTILSVAPTKICVGGGTLVITGTGFSQGAQVLLDGKPADQVSVDTDTQTITATFASGALVVGGPYDLEVQNPGNCSATETAAVTVVPGPQLFFADPPVVYSEISTKITLYGSGFTGSVGFIGIRLTGTTDTPEDLSASITVHPTNPNRLQVVIPEGTVAGSYDIILKDQTTCDAVLVDGLKVVDEITFTIASIEPPFGYTGASTPVTVFADTTAGDGFQPVPRLYLNTTGGSQAAGLVSVAYVDSSRVTAVVPSGLTPETYDLIAVNPDGSVALLADAFKVTELPPPTVESITPGSIPNNSVQAVTVKGQDFRSPSVLLRCIDANSGEEVDNLPTVDNSTDTEVNMSVDAAPFVNGAVCVVRIINGDDQTYGELSALVVTNLAQNLSVFSVGPSMVTPRRALSSVSNQATRAARFVYAIGGDDGTATGTLDSVEVAPVDIFGLPGDFFTQTYTLGTPRSFATAVALDRCIYLAGGFDGAGVMDAVERACVLDPEDRPEIMDLDLHTVDSDGMAPGLWYYQVSAQMPADHPFNPGGETLPSEPFPLWLPDLTGKQITVTVHWSQVPGSTGYRIYRSPVAGAATSEVELIATVSGETTTQYTDTGDAAQGAGPLRLGATGTWHQVATLNTGRQGAGAAMAPDPVTPGLHHLYVVGGKDATTALVSCERISITVNADGTQSVGPASTETATLGEARWQLAAYSVGNDEASFVSPPTHYIYAAGGVATNGTTERNEVVVFEVLAGGDLGAPTTVDDMQPSRAGYGYAAANNFLFAFGGNKADPDATVTSIKICQSSVPQCVGGPPELENWNNASIHLTELRYLLGSAIQSGFIYLLGGQTLVESATATTEYTIW